MVNLLKTRWKLSVLDIIIIIAAIAALGLVLLLLYADRGSITLSAGKPVELEYVLQLSNIEEKPAYAVQVGETVMETVEKHTIGTITAVSVEPYEATTNDYANGGKVMSPIPDRYFVNITIKVNVRDNGEEFAVDGFAIRANSSISVSGPDWTGLGLVTSIVR